MTLHAHLSPLSAADYLEGELRSQVRHEIRSGASICHGGCQRGA